MDAQPETVESYDKVMRAVHWTTLLLIAGAFIAVWIADPELIGRSSAALIVQIHRSLGLTVVALTVFRLAWRWRARIPALPGDLPAVQKWAARANEVLIYMVLLTQPIVGLLYSNAYGVRVKLFLLFELPPVIARDLSLGEQLGAIHNFLGYSLLVLVGAHAAAALFHHFVRRDQVLNAMLPSRLRGIGRGVLAPARSRQQS